MTGRYRPHPAWDAGDGDGAGRFGGGVDDKSGRRDPGRGGSGRRKPTRGGDAGRRSGGQAGQAGRARKDTRSDRGEGRPSGQQRRSSFQAGGGAETLPQWVRDEVIRSTPKDRRGPALHQLAEAADEYAEGRYKPAAVKLAEAKRLAPRVATIRELLGLTCYRLGQWQEALKELRTFRRLTGETTHMPVEMDALRALGRPSDVRKTWDLFLELGGSHATDDEARVVYASFLLDEGEARTAWKIVDPGRITRRAHESQVRRWFVAARVALALGDTTTAHQLLRAVEDYDASFPGLDELERAIAARQEELGT